MVEMTRVHLGKENMTLPPICFGQAIGRNIGIDETTASINVGVGDDMVPFKPTDPLFLALDLSLDAVMSGEW